MLQVTPASLAYMATQVYLFSKPDIDPNLETFYLSILELSNDVEELKEVNVLRFLTMLTIFGHTLLFPTRTLDVIMTSSPPMTSFLHHDFILLHYDITTRTV